MGFYYVFAWNGDCRRDASRVVVVAFLWVVMAGLYGTFSHLAVEHVRKSAWSLAPQPRSLVSDPTWIRHDSTMFGCVPLVQTQPNGE